MKKIILLLTATSFLFAACDSCKKPTPPKDPPAGPHNLPLDSADKMINSYLKSIHSDVNDTDLRSLTIDAASLKAYINNPNVTKVKFMLAHTLSYASSPAGSSVAGYKSNALTIIIACVDASGNYVYLPPVINPSVLDYMIPCPDRCTSAGTAAADTIPLPLTHGGHK